MSSFQISATLAFLFFALSVFADDVVVLTEDNFEKEVGQDRGALVEFYAPWYYHLFSVLYLCSLPFSETLRINLYHMGNHILIHYLNELNLRHWSCFYFDRCLSWKLAPRLMSCVEICWFNCSFICASINLFIQILLLDIWFCVFTVLGV